MSEKRIYFTRTSDFCLDLRLEKDINGKWVRYCASDASKDWKDITEKDCKRCKKARYLGITREQAIERMAKGICSCDCDYLCGDCSCLDDAEACKRFVENAGYDKLSEAALNALLEAEK